MSTKITDLRGSRLRPIHRGSVLLSKQEDLCSTSYFLLYELLLSIGNTPALRVTLREGRILPLYESLCRAGGKPSTWFPPGTRRANHLIHNRLFWISSMGRTSNINFQIHKFLIRIFIKNRKFHHFSTFSRRHVLVVNLGLVELGSWNSHKIQLQYNINDLNVTNQ